LTKPIIKLIDYLNDKFWMGMNSMW